MSYFLRIIFFFFLISFTLPQQKDWSSTTFDYYWNRVVGQMQFREPVQSSPFEVRMGYYTYGSSSYWDAPFSLDQDLNYAPIHLDSTNIGFSQISSSSERSGLLFEIDFFRFNAGNKIYNQNYLDWQVGLGYKYFNLLNRVKLPPYWQEEELVEENGSYYFRPKIHDFNVNYTLIFQPLDFLLFSWYHSLGYSAGYIYETDSDRSYLFADGISESFSIGIKIPLNSESANYNFVYGLEYKWNRSYLRGDDSSQQKYPRNINSIDLYSNGVFLTFGLLFGGYKTKGDRAFELMLDRNYGEASSLFEDFIVDYPNHGKLVRAKNMLQFCSSQIPYENIVKTIENINDKDLDLAINNLRIAEEYNISELESEIAIRKDDIARLLIDSLLHNVNTMDFRDAEELTTKAYSLSPENLFVKNMHSQLYLKKADILVKNGDYSSAIKSLDRAVSIYPGNIQFYNNKIMQISILMMDEVNESFNDGSYIVAINLLEKISEINPDLNSKTSKAIANLKQKLQDKETKHVNKLISTMADRYKQAKQNMEIKINLGMTYYEVREAIGDPNVIDKVSRYDRDYQMWTYYLDDKSKRYYFEDHLLTKIE